MEIIKYITVLIKSKFYERYYNASATNVPSLSVNMKLDRVVGLHICIYLQNTWLVDNISLSWITTTMK